MIGTSIQVQFSHASTMKGRKIHSFRNFPTAERIARFWHRQPKQQTRMNISEHHFGPPPLHDPLTSIVLPCSSVVAGAVAVASTAAPEYSRGRRCSSGLQQSPQLRPQQRPIPPPPPPPAGRASAIGTSGGTSERSPAGRRAAGGGGQVNQVLVRNGSSLEYQFVVCWGIGARGQQRLLTRALVVKGGYF